MRFKLVTLLALTAVKASAIPTLIDISSFSTSSGPDWRQSNNYLLYNCASTLPQITSALTQTISALRAIVLPSTSTTAAYKAFFKSAPPFIVASVLDKIEVGSIVDVLPVTAPHRRHRATLVCVDDKATDLAPVWQLCEKNPRRLVAYHITGTSLVFLCPRFLSLPFAVENDGNEDRCGTLDSTDSRFVGDYDTNATQYGALVRALAHVYVPTVVPPEQRLKGQVMDVNDCLALSAEQALANPSSYSFYVTNLKAGCTDFPHA